MCSVVHLLFIHFYIPSSMPIRKGVDFEFSQFVLFLIPEFCGIIGEIKDNDEPGECETVPGRGAHLIHIFSGPGTP